jgi:polyketide synthase 5
MACRLPGDIKSPNEFWDMLCREEDVVSEIPGDRWKKEEFITLT